MGTVYLARDIALGRPVALKVLLGSLAKNPAMVRGFYREAQAAAPLRHPGIVRVFTAGIEGGTPFIAMEYVPGEPLDRFLRRKGRVSWQAALYVGGQVAAALQCAHDAGIIHRDIKPANILLDRQGRVRLTDFGIARVCAVEQAGTEPSVIGTPQYMSPEQCAGGDVSHATDLYSLGVTLFQLIAGNLPFKADSAQALMRLIAEEPAPRLNRLIPEVPDDVARLVAHLLEKEPERRPASALEVAQTIERLRAEDGGRSAIPQALAAYVREQAQDSPLRVLTPPPSKDKANPTQSERPAKSFSPGRMALITALAFVAVASISAMAVWSVRGTAPVTTPAPRLDSCTFTSQPDGSVLASVPASAFRADRIGWIHGDNALLVEVTGDPSTLARGAAGMLALRPEAKECLSVVPPVGATLAEGAAAADAAPLALASGLRAGKGAASILLAQRTGPSGMSASGLIYVQRWNEAAPALNPAASFISAINRDVLEAGGRCVQAVLRPDGGAVCVLVEREDGSNYLIEQRVYGSAPGEALTGNGPRILPESIQYAPAGDRIVYLRQDGRGKQELWSTPTHGGASVLLAIGYFEGEAAIGPAGDRIAAAWGASPVDSPELRIISMSDGRTLQRLGHATVGHDAWLPSGGALVAAARGENGTRQLWLKGTESSVNDRALTAIERGVRVATAVSADGKWAAGIAVDGPGARIVFVELPHPHDMRTALRGATPQDSA